MNIIFETETTEQFITLDDVSLRPGDQIDWGFQPTLPSHIQPGKYYVEATTWTFAPNVVLLRVRLRAL